uniref:Uncharacterized protein n=1 Tax=Pundamilia nyererei TaxID=303518 RepID=A0A3B4G8F0_9CICH
VTCLRVSVYFVSINMWEKSYKKKKRESVQRLQWTEGPGFIQASQTCEQDLCLKAERGSANQGSRQKPLLVCFLAGYNQHLKFCARHCQVCPIEVFMKLVVSMPGTQAIVTLTSCLIPEESFSLVYFLQSDSVPSVVCLWSNASLAGSNVPEGQHAY